MRVLVTGASGFIGSALVRHLSEAGVTVRAAVRAQANAQSTSFLNLNVESCVIGDIGEGTDWSQALSDVDVVIHAAGRVHVLRESAANPLREFRKVNVAGTARLARKAVDSGVQRLVYLSSVKVNGQMTKRGEKFSELDLPGPTDEYALSKLEAEAALKSVADLHSLETVIVRPTLVYGPGASGNVAAMLSWLRRGIPLPLDCIANARSLISVDNLCSLLSVCVNHPKAAGETFLVADERPVSTPDILRLLANGMGRKANLYPVSDRLLKLASTLCGMGKAYRRLCCSLVVDTTKAVDRLGWRPHISVDLGLMKTGQSYSELLGR
jgi:nucleoside-diphosphate-sugar epimerase